MASGNPLAIRWQFETDTPGVWQDMDRATSDFLETAFRERPQGEITIQCDESLSYDYNFKDMWQQRYDDARKDRDRNKGREYLLINSFSHGRFDMEG